MKQNLRSSVANTKRLCVSLFLLIKFSISSISSLFVHLAAHTLLLNHFARSLTGVWAGRSAAHTAKKSKLSTFLMQKIQISNSVSVFFCGTRNSFAFDQIHPNRFSLTEFESPNNSRAPPSSACFACFINQMVY